jgi:hypothetical protein
MRRAVWIVLAVLVVGFLILLGFGFCFGCLFGHPPSPARNAAVALRSIASAQGDYRTNDRDGDGVKQFWRADIAGLFTRAPGGGPAIKLIEISVAAADDRPASDPSPHGIARSAKGGYWFRAIRHANEDPKALDPARFAACAFPDSPSHANDMFVVDERDVVYRTPAVGRRGVEVFPTEEELVKTWSKLD